MTNDRRRLRLRLLLRLSVVDVRAFGDDEDEHVARPRERVAKPGFDRVKPTGLPHCSYIVLDRLGRCLATGRDFEFFQNRRGGDRRVSLNDDLSDELAFWIGI